MLESDPEWVPSVRLGHMEVKASTTGCSDKKAHLPFGNDAQHTETFRMNTETVSFDNWQYRQQFTFVKEEGKNITVQCNLCKPKINYLSSSKKSTSNLLKHLRRKHPGKFEKRIKKGKIIAPGQPLHIARQEKEYQDPSKVHSLVLNFILEDVQPFSLLKKPGFSKLIEGLSGMPWVMDEVTLMADIERAFITMKTSLVAKLNKVQSLCTTADIWTVHNRSYFGMTCHWIEESELQRKSAALACVRLRGVHTYLSIAAQIHEIHVSYNIERKVESVVTDNGSSLVKVFKEFADDGDDDNDVGGFEDLGAILEGQSEEDIPVFLPSLQRCVSHILHLIATEDLVQAMSRGTSYRVYYCVMAKCSAIWTQAHRSQPGVEVVDDMAKMPLIVPAVMRWSSEYCAVQKIASLTAGQLREACARLEVPEPQAEEVSFLKEYVGVFRPLAFACDLLQEEQKCFLGLVIPTLLTLKKKLSEKKTAACFFSDVIDAILEAVDTRFQQLFAFPEAKMATATTPQFRLWWLPEADREDMRRLLVDKVAQVDAKPGANDESAPIESDDFFSYGPGGERLDEPAVEVWKYLETSSKSLESLRDFPRVRKLFVKYNTILPSCTPVLRLFRHKGNLATTQSNRQTDEYFERVVLLGYNSMVLLGCHSNNNL